MDWSNCFPLLQVIKQAGGIMNAALQSGRLTAKQASDVASAFMRSAIENVSI